VTHKSRLQDKSQARQKSWIYLCYFYKIINKTKNELLEYFIIKIKINTRTCVTLQKTNYIRYLKVHSHKNPMNNFIIKIFSHKNNTQMHIFSQSHMRVICSNNFPAPCFLRTNI